MRDMTRSPTAVPLRPAYGDAAEAHVRSYWRSVGAVALAHALAEPTEEVVARLWPRDQQAATFVRAATVPASMGTSGWAAELSQNTVAPFLSGVQHKSGAARLFNECLRISLAGSNTAKLPQITTALSGSFVGEGQPIGVVQG